MEKTLNAIGWIPNIIGDISLLNPFSSLNTFDLQEFQLNSLHESNYLLKFPKKLYQYYIISDLIDDEPALFVYLFKSEKDQFPSEILLFIINNFKYEKICNVEITWDYRGLVTFFLKNLNEKIVLTRETPPSLMRQFFSALINLYQEYLPTEFLSENDSFTDRIIMCSSQEIAINEIINNYKRKILLYISLSNNISINYFSLKNSLKLSRDNFYRASLDIDYGIKFLLFFKNKISSEEYNQIDMVFKNALTLIKSRDEYFNRIYDQITTEQNNIVIKLTVLTILIAEVTLFAVYIPDQIKIVILFTITVIFFMNNIISGIKKGLKIISE